MQLPYYPVEARVDIGLERSRSDLNHAESIPEITVNPVVIGDQAVGTSATEVLYGLSGQPIFDLVFQAGFGYRIRQLRPVLASVLSKITVTLYRTIGQFAGDLLAYFDMAIKEPSTPEWSHYHGPRKDSGPNLEAVFNLFKAFKPYTAKGASESNVAFPVDVLHFAPFWYLDSRDYSPTSYPEIVQNRGTAEMIVETISDEGLIVPTNGSSFVVVSGGFEVE